MRDSKAPSIADSGMPSRTSILVAAARAFGSREPEECVRNPDALADRLIGPEELALIPEHAIHAWRDMEYAEASQNRAIALYGALMLTRTRYIDDAMLRAVKAGATQVVILGAGFDSRAYRFRDELAHCRVIEVDAAPTQAYKRRRVEAAAVDVPPNLTYCTVDFTADDLMDRLGGAGWKQREKTVYIWEGVCMYLTEQDVRKTLEMVRSHSAPGSVLVLDYPNSLAIDFGKFTPGGLGGIPEEWQEPWLFGVPGANGSEFFRELGFEPGVPSSSFNKELTGRYATREDGTLYAAHVFEQMRKDGEARMQNAPIELIENQKAIAAAGGAYWLAELIVPECG
jgi:methyltransferase (TIGR00027 family)